ncbi:MAG: aldolase/citrate lyase family protein [Deltaproteobacteria bacterium]
MSESIRLRRSLLFEPGAEARKIEKAASAGADTLVLDLEDSVALDHKDEARRLVTDAIAGRSLGQSEVAVRVNAPATPSNRAPLLGEHTDEILAEILDMSEAEIGALHDKGLVAGPESS